jgi:hypothetical protein
VVVEEVVAVVGVAVAVEEVAVEVVGMVGKPEGKQVEDKDNRRLGRPHPRHHQMALVGSPSRRSVSLLDVFGWPTC